MNYTLTDLPDSGSNPVVYMDISLKGEVIGTLLIRLFRDVFPAGVENFVNLAGGQTYQIIQKGSPPLTWTQDTIRTYTGTKFYHFLHNNYLIGGDIYSNNGTKAGTIYNDEPIPAHFGDFYYQHDAKGLLSLIPYVDNANGNMYYDSTFMITLDDAKPTNALRGLDRDQIVIGQVYSGLDVLDKMNQLIKPFAGRRYPEFVISSSGLLQNRNGITTRRKQQRQKPHRKFISKPVEVPNLNR